MLETSCMEVTVQNTNTPAMKGSAGFQTLSLGVSPCSLLKNDQNFIISVLLHYLQHQSQRKLPSTQARTSNEDSEMPFHTRTLVQTKDEILH